MRLRIIFCLVLCFSTLTAFSQEDNKPDTSEYMKDVDGIFDALLQGEIDKADAQLSYSLDRILQQKENTHILLKFFINYCSEKIHHNIELSRCFLKAANTDKHLTKKDINKYLTVYFAYHDWLLWYNKNNKDRNALKIYADVNNLWFDIFSRINNKQIKKTQLCVRYHNENILNDGILPSIVVDEFLINHLIYGEDKFEANVTDVIKKLQHYNVDIYTYLISIADNLSVCGDLILARGIYSVCGDSPKWEEYALSQVCQICCKLGDADSVMNIYISRLFLDYEYEDINNYYIDVLSICPYLEPQLAIEVAKKAYDKICNIQINDKQWKQNHLLSIIGKNYYLEGDFVNAANYLGEALQLSDSKSKVQPLETIKLYVSSMIHIGMMDFNDALPIYEQVFVEDTMYAPDDLLDTSYRIYELHSLNGNTATAEEYLSLSFNLLKDKAIDMLLKLTSHERGLFWSNLSNSKIFRVLHLSPKINYDIQLIKKSLLLQTDINIALAVKECNDKEIEELYKQIISNPNDQSNEIYKLEQEFINLFAKKSNALSHILYTYSDIHASLQEGQIAIEFLDGYNAEGEKQYAALILHKDWDAPKMVVLCDDNELKSLVKLNPENKRWRNSNAGTKKLIQQYYEKGYQLIWSKLEPYINNGDEVYFSPSGLLHQINVEVLQDESGRLANEKYKLHRVSSTRELCINRAKTKLNSAVLYGGLQYDMDSAELLTQSREYSQTYDYVATRGFEVDSTFMRDGLRPLNGAEDEVNAISKNLNEYGIKTIKYIQTAGTEESFKALSGKRTPIIHLATHGFFYTNEEAQKKSYFEMLTTNQTSARPDNSLKRSGLILAGAQLAWDGKDIPSSVEDGILLAEEIATMDLSGTDLVVLSACETGLGEITSEGVFGLQRAFKKAGVQTLIMSLWKVDDTATKLMMTTFYKEWLSGKSKHEAFVTAQQKVRNEYNNPYYWASFIMLD